MTALHPSYGPTFRSNDRLTGSELKSWQQVPLFAAARHFHGLHRLYGVADGLIVTLENNEIEVSKGVAYDAYGRPLLWSRPDSKLDLNDWLGAGLKPDEKEESRVVILQGEKPKHGQLKVPVPGPQKCEVVAVDSSCKVQPWEVPLATLSKVKVGNAVTPVIDLAIRPITIRTFRRPYIATDIVPSGTTAVSIANGQGWQLWISTKPAGFLPPLDLDSKLPQSAADQSCRAPVYLVSIGSQSAEDAQRLRTGQPIVDRSKSIPLNSPLVSVSQPRHDGFMLTVTYDPSVKGLKEFSSTPLEIQWMGIERRASADDRLSFRKFDQTEGYNVAQSVVQPQLPWPIFRNDQRLTASDLNDQQQTVRMLQWIHNRTLHDWGVAEGCTVTELPDGRAVLVQPGYALDVEGREVIITEPTQLNLPAQKVSSGPNTQQTWLVTASYGEVQAPRNGDPSPYLQGVPLRRLPEGVVGWRDPEATENALRFEPGYDVILATVELKQGAVVSLTSVGRRSAVPPKRPYIYASRQELKKSDPSDPPKRKAGTGVDPELLKKDWHWTKIDTSEAEFVGLPQYLFTIELNTGKGPIDLTAQPFIEEPGRTQFYLALPRSWFGDDSGGQGTNLWCWLTLAMLGLAILFQLLRSDQMPEAQWPKLAWLGSGAAAMLAALPTLLAAWRPGSPRSTQPASVSDPAVSWETLLKNLAGKWIDRLVPRDFFRDKGGTKGVSRWWLLATAGLPIPMVLAHAFRSSDSPSWSSWLVWGVSIVCALVAAAPSLATASQGLWQKTPVTTGDDNIVMTIAWVGIEI
jgi:hypothetical protein